MLKSSYLPRPILARSRDSVFLHCRIWPGDPEALADILASRPEPVRYVTVPWDAVPSSSIHALEQAVRGAGGRLRFIDYATSSPESDELGFRLSMTLHEEEHAHAAGA